ncbi:MAG TPA: glycosyltransferase family 2 protein [Candidatus Saccharibacteria bacterium]|jgi:biofilm PGA synthesis N-glycosyltransferase PgaC|nr:glycosyltransferase family 2 protein [Candidatus Saccharibacteria bacterium]HMT55648.1 glycosyltransferase family 2 protein [Candidatus Saccharibacteria bacterium]
MLFSLFLLIGLIYTLHLGLYAAGANIQDILSLKDKAEKAPRKERLPLVTVLIAAYNEELSIEKSISTVWNSNYPRLEIIVVDDGSNDKTYDIVRSYISKADSLKLTRGSIRRSVHGTLSRRWKRQNHDDYRVVRLIAKENGGKSSALNTALLRGVNGEFVMTLDADSILDPYAIRRAVDYFDDETVVGVAANVRVLFRPTILGIIQQFEHLIGYRSKKFYRLTNSELIVGGVASTYRTSTLKKVGYYDTDTQTEDIGLSMKIASLGNKEHKLIYGADVLAATQGVQKLGALLKQRYRWKLGNLQNLIKFSASYKPSNKEQSASLKYYRVPMAFLGEILLMLEPVILAYVLYLSISIGSPVLFVGSYVVITAYILQTVWSDEHYSLREKLQMSYYAPAMYFLFYIMDFVQLAAIFRCLVNPKKVLRLVETDGRWVSPERHGFAQSN